MDPYLNQINSYVEKNSAWTPREGGREEQQTLKVGRVRGVKILPCPRVHITTHLPMYGINNGA